MSLFSLALGLAHAGHAGQFRRGGDGTVPYVTHPIRVAGMLVNFPPQHRAAAVIHDLLEDNKAITPEVLLAAGMDPVVVEAVVLLTRRKNETYAHFIERILSNHEGLGHSEAQRIAAMVKAVDIIDNLMGDPSTTKVRVYINSLKLLVQTFPEIEINFARCPNLTSDRQGTLLDVWSYILVTEDMRLDHLNNITPT